VENVGLAVVAPVRDGGTCAEMRALAGCAQPYGAILGELFGRECIVSVGVQIGQRGKHSALRDP